MTFEKLAIKVVIVMSGDVILFYYIIHINHRCYHESRMAVPAHWWSIFKYGKFCGIKTHYGKHPVEIR